MIHLVAIVVGVLVVAMVAGFFYVIYSVIKHFRLDIEDVEIGVMSIAIVLALSWVFGTLALELLGMI